MLINIYKYIFIYVYKKSFSFIYIYNKYILLGIISKLYCIQGTNIIKAIIKGNSTVQQNDINWSKRILGKEALAQINIKIITELLNPKHKP